MISKWKRQLYAFFSARYRLCSLKEDPEKLAKGIVYVVGDYGYLWRAIMLCPCGCGDSIYLNLNEETHPAWKVYKTNGYPTIFPSIDRQKGCKAHFLLIEGKVKWAN